MIKSTWQIIEGDCLAIMPTFADLSVDHVITDPPYAEETHKGARTAPKKGSGKPFDEEPQKLISFESITVDALRLRLNEVGRLTRRWTIATVDWRHIYHFEKEPPTDLRFVRFGIWYKPNGTPQFTGDRPATGWEGVAHFHRKGGRMRWNGGGHAGFYQHNIETSGLYPTMKPLSLIREFITLFTDPGDTILDPFCGSGTTGLACLPEGRNFIGIDSDPAACELARARLARASGVPCDMPARRNFVERERPLFTEAQL